ncbi:MAG TPA: HNH endonuclease signature motif containing protein [Mycobacteriales bacterium]|nr:HNH endonuclease signature motif containing protein [Mycobacteriales bacterium]
MTPSKGIVIHKWPDRFWAKVNKTDSCWLWTGTLTTPGDRGYGQVRLNGQFPLVHRVAYEMLVGPIPEGMQIDHLCRVRRCVNPAHLEPVTNRENTARGTSLNGINARKTHCKRGHKLSGDNLRWDNGGKSRRCLQCERDRRPNARTEDRPGSPPAS